MTKGYEIVVDAYQGPMDVLMDLIDKNKVDIYDIPVVTITEQFLLYLNQMKECNLEVTSEFLLLAATLIEIKARMLLPKTIIEEEEEDPRIDLVERLMEYRSFKHFALELHNRQHCLEDRYFKPGEDLSKYIDEESNEGSLYIMAEDIIKVWEKVTKERKIKKSSSYDFNPIERDLVSVEEKMVEIQKLLKQNRMMRLEELFELSESRQHLIAAFLAVLEMVKNRTITIHEKDGLFNLKIQTAENILSA